MSENRKYIEYLLLRYLENKSTDQEKTQLFQLLEKQENDQLYKDILEEILFAEPAMNEYKSEEWQPLLEQIKTRNKPGAKVRKIPRHRQYIWWAAAAVLIVIAATWLFTSNQKNTATTTEPAIAEIKTMDVAPGGNRAILTVGDGSKIILDSAASGTLTVEGNTKVIKEENGGITYIAGNNTNEKVVYNTMTTPRGGQYKLTLPDGSRVWLNAASSITYPTLFTGNTREVTITGEAYFEVAKNEQQPFQVKTGDMRVEVLGTHFNVNAYADEAVKKTTLIEGAVKINAGNESGVLKPGNQSKVNKNGSIELIENADIKEATAWKNGGFYFNGVDIQTIMRQVERWYDVTVIYEHEIPNGHYIGKPSRNLSLSQMLKVFEYSGLKFRIEKSTIIVM